MIRLSLLYLFVAVVAMDAWRNWFRALCWLVLMMAVVEHPDMPKSILGIPGFNPWNLLFLNVLAAWLLSRRRERLTWDVPLHVSLILLLYWAVVFVGFLRMMADRDLLADSTNGLIQEYLFNTFKWTVPGMMFFDGCRTRRRFLLGTAALLGVYFLLAIQVIRWMPPSAVVSGADLAARSLKLLGKEIGYHRVNLSTMLAGASWAIFAARGLPRQRFLSVLVVVAAGLTAYAQAVTGGRAGYVAWAVAGLMLGLLRWRRYLFVAPLAVMGLLSLVPGMRERMLTGIDTSPMADREVDADLVTADRTKIWPVVIARIGKSPVVGYGRQAMQRGLTRELKAETGELFTQPHNAYLEWLLDNGWLGLVPVALFLFVVIFHAVRLFVDGRSPIFVAAGGATLAIVLTLLVASMSSQTFYPREGAVPMWCAFGLLFRVTMERSRALAALRPRRGAARERVTAPAPVETSGSIPASIGSYSRLAAAQRATLTTKIDQALWATAPR